MSGEPLLTWKGRRVRSLGDGPETAARKVPSALRPGSLFFVPSPLEGWGLHALLERLPADGAVVVFEKDHELTQHCAAAWDAFMGPRAHDPRLWYLDHDSEDSVRTLFRQLPLSKLRRCEFMTFSGSWMAHGSRYREIFARFENGLNRWWSNRMTALHMGPLWIRNLLSNLATFQQEPWPHWGDQPILVCGAGITLETALPWALRHRQEIRLVAADTALPVLRAWNLTADAVVCLESQHANLRDFAGWKGADVSLFTDLTSFPPGSRVFGKPARWFISEFAEISLWDRWPWNDVPRLPPLGSVGVAAAWVAWRISSGPVIVAGLDFSFPHGATHARGAPSLSRLAAETDRFHPMEQINTWFGDGRKSTATGWLTTSVMEGYAEVLSDQAREFQERTWVWSKQGLPLGLRVWDSASQLPPSQPVNPSIVSPQQQGPIATEWLEEERKRWQRALALLERLNQIPDEAAWNELEDELRAADYLTFSFPDPEFRRATDWLTRAQSQLRWALARTMPREG